MLSECLDDSSMGLGVPFIAPRQLGVVGGQLGRPNLPSVGWCTGQSGARFPSNFGASDRWSSGSVGTLPVHTGQSGVPNRPLLRATRRPRIARPTVALATVGSSDSPVNYSRTPPSKPESGEFTAD